MGSECTYISCARTSSPLPHLFLFLSHSPLSLSLSLLRLPSPFSFLHSLSDANYDASSVAYQKWSLDHPNKDCLDSTGWLGGRSHDQCQQTCLDMGNNFAITHPNGNCKCSFACDRVQYPGGWKVYKYERPGETCETDKDKGTQKNSVSKGLILVYSCACACACACACCSSDV